MSVLYLLNTTPCHVNLASEHYQNNMPRPVRVLPQQPAAFTAAAV